MKISDVYIEFMIDFWFCRESDGELSFKEKLNIFSATKQCALRIFVFLVPDDDQKTQ